MKKILNATIVLAAVAGTAQADIVLDGVLGGADSYSNTESVTWFNGHQTANSFYGDFGNQSHTTNISYGVSTFGGADYFFLHVEAPLYAKNMIWENRDWGDEFVNTDPNAGLIEGDVTSYRVHHETHHNPFSMNLDFNGATGSEKMFFLDSNGDGVFGADLDGNADNAFGLVGYKDSVDYLLDNGLSTVDLSLARDTTMSFEFMFELDSAMNEQILEYARNGIEFHMSPERGLPVPAPASAALLGLGGMLLAKRRR